MLVPPPPPPKPVTAVYFLLAAVFFMGLQLTNNAFNSDLGGDPDEGAHAVTALMVRDYFWSGMGTQPLEFATRYYDTFPKVALGHYPPGYYLPGAVALSLWSDPAALIVLQALWAAVLAVLGWLFAQRWITDGQRLLAVLPSLMVLTLSEVVRVGCHVLADLQLSVLVFASIWAWHWYLQRPSWRAALSFGGLATAAILTKGSAMGLAGIPVLSVLLGWRWTDLKRFDWWGAALPVALIAGPWMLYSVRFTQEGFVDQSLGAFFADAVGYYSKALPRVLGWPLIAIGIVSMGRLTADVFYRRVDSVRLVLWSGCLSMQGLVMVVPTGFSDRYLLPCVLPLALVMVVEIRYWVELIFTKAQFAGGRATPQLLVVGLFLVATGIITHRDRPKLVEGFSQVVQQLSAARRDGVKEVWLVASDPRGEGAIIAAAAYQTVDRLSGDVTVKRGSKSLVETDWLGKNYQPLFSDASSLLGWLTKQRVTAVLVDLSMPFEKVQAHEKRLKKALDSPGSGWQVAWKQEIHRGRGQPAGDLWVYRVSNQEGGD